MSRSADGLRAASAGSDPGATEDWLPVEVASVGSGPTRPLGTGQRLLLALAQVTERERVLKAAEELAQLGSWTWTVGSDAAVWSEQVYRIFGTDPGDPPADYSFYMKMVHPDDLDRVLAVIRAAEKIGRAL